MKKIFSIIFLIAICGIAINCSNDSENINQRPNNLRLSDDEIEVGYIDESDNFILDLDAIKDIESEWEDDYNTSFKSFSIIKKLTIPDPNDPLQSGGGEEYYLLIGTTTSDAKVGMRLQLTLSKFTASLDPELTVSCGGCFAGCNIESYKDIIIGKMYYYCGDPCTTCSKTETMTNAPF